MHAGFREIDLGHHSHLFGLYSNTIQHGGRLSDFHTIITPGRTTHERIDALNSELGRIGSNQRVDINMVMNNPSAVNSIIGQLSGSAHGRVFLEGLGDRGR